MALVVIAVVVYVIAAGFALALLPLDARMPINFHNGFEQWLRVPSALLIFGGLSALGAALLLTEDGSKAFAGGAVLVGVIVFFPLIVGVAVMEDRSTPSKT